MNTERLIVGLAQIDIAWEAPEENLQKVYQMLRNAQEKQVELLVFPEVVLTGFSMNIPEVADSFPSSYLEKIQQYVSQTGVAMVSSILVKEKDKYYNRAFLLTPEHSATSFQDKRHIFRMGGESKYIAPAKERNIFTYKGWNILMIVCYDLRFPVWCRNTNNEYDLLIDVANWPKARRQVWTALLQARAMENLTYVCGVNRVGEDPEGLVYTGDSAVFDSRGKNMITCQEAKEVLEVVVLEKEPMEKLREKFPVWKDADHFSLDMQADPQE